jgi:hypothetical protein
MANARQKLAELLKGDPSLIDDLRSMLAEEPTTEAPEELSHTFMGVSSEAPTKSQTGRSLKYQVDAIVDGADPDDDDAPKAIVIAYLPAELATENVVITVVADGVSTAGRIVKRNTRKKAS